MRRASGGEGFFILMTSESDEQKQIVAYFRQRWPQYALSLRVSQSGGYRGAGRKGAIRTAQVAAMGGDGDVAEGITGVASGAISVVN